MSKQNRVFIAGVPEVFLGDAVGSGQCVPFVQKATNPNVPHTSTWKPGAKVQGNQFIKPGTAIATFQNGAYQNAEDGRSHAAIYIEQNEHGMWVFDQWYDKKRKKQQVVHERFIIFRNGVGKPNNDGSAYSVIEAP